MLTHALVGCQKGGTTTGATNLRMLFQWHWRNTLTNVFCNLQAQTDDATDPEYFAKYDKWGLEDYGDEYTAPKE